MKNILSKLLVASLIVSISFMVSCSADVEDDTPSLNVSNIVLPLDEMSDVSQVVSEDSSVTTSQETSSNSTSSTPSSSSKPSSSQTSSVDYSYTASIPETYDGDWNLILVNSNNLLPADFNVKTDKIGKWLMDERIVDIVEQMFADAKADGVDLMICSSYRTVERQTTLFENQIQEFLNEGYSAEQARIEAAKWVAVPRTSEHHTGLALDIVTPTYQMLDFGFADTAAFKWLSTHCTEYGFILRYPKDKTDITGIVYEPWHYRYVGVEAAKYIHENGLTLEEYLGK